MPRLNSSSSAIASISSSYISVPLQLTAPRTASRSSVVLAAEAEYRHCSAVSRDGVATVARLQVREHPATLVAHRCGITPRSTGAPTAGHQRPGGGTRYIFTARALASRRRRPVTSNVRRRSPPLMQIETSLKSVLLRPWAKGDEEQLAAQANDREIWRNLLSGFPSPYTIDDAAFWVSHALERPPTVHLCIQVNGAVAGGIGVIVGTGTEEKTGQFGYWLGRQYWGHGIATAAASAMLRHAITNLPVVRLQAPVFEWNPRSMRVLEKVGFQREGVLRKSVFKEGKLIDSVLYAYISNDA
jgi:[ribosomal protein S5]-alanine N-acetyltransferase